MYASAGHAGTARSQAVQNQAPWNGTPGIIAAGAGEPCLCVQTWFPTKKESEDDCNEEKIKNREPGRPGADADDDEYLPDGCLSLAGIVYVSGCLLCGQRKIVLYLLSVLG